MSEEEAKEMITVSSSRFGDITVAAETIIEFPAGLIGFSRGQRFIMLEHSPPFSWLQSVDEPDLAFVVVDGFEFGENYKVEPPIGDREIDLKEDDEFGILVVVTVRSNAADTTANLKAPLFVNLRNRKGVQVIFDNPNLSTRFPLWAQEEEGEEEKSSDQEQEKPSEDKSEK